MCLLMLYYIMIEIQTIEQTSINIWLCTKSGSRQIEYDVITIHNTLERYIVY